MGYFPQQYGLYVELREQQTRLAEDDAARRVVVHGVLPGRHGGHGSRIPGVCAEWGRLHRKFVGYDADAERGMAESEQRGDHHRWDDNRGIEQPVFHTAV